jgi:hypothetical protein
MVTLSGTWKLAVDPENRGREECWFDSIRSEAQDAPVPGVIQQVFPAYHGVAWYWHVFRYENPRAAGDRILIRFGAVDYLADVWINGQHVGSFEGGETPFEFDVTDTIDVEGDNLLAVRVLNPTNTPIDGYVLVQTPHRNKVMTPQAGCSFNSGGIMYPVEVRTVPPVYITDVFLRPDVATGMIAISATVRNSTTAPTRGVFLLDVAVAQATGDLLQSAAQEAVFAPGESRHELALEVNQPHLWNLDDPFLYQVTVAARTSWSEAPEQRQHQLSVRCGFRDFRIVDGYFELNGKRLFLKCSHTGNHMPIGMQAPVIPDLVRRDLINAKAAGFNTIRTSAGVAYPEQLDLCDEIGLMVMEECFASWLLGGASYAGQYPSMPYSPILEDRYDHSTAAMVRRDRNHPSVTMWELLNETEDGPLFQHAHEFLPRLRELDPTRLVLLNSGRFDGRFDIGSASNPGSGMWEHVWGAEGLGVPQVHGLHYPSRIGAGDFHFYPTVPQSSAADTLIRNLGQDTKPVFLSEYGIGSLFDVIREWRHFEQAGAQPDLEDASWAQEQSEGLYADWRRLGLDNVYPFPEDLLRESQRLSARQRTLGFNLIRANPRLCGYSLTGMLDHAMCGEGLWTFWREWKPAMFDAVSDGWSPLRWCLFADPLHGYVGREVTVEAVLATEDVLRPGAYPARFRVFGPAGPIWEKSAIVTIPDPAPLAIPVIHETFRLAGPPGEYIFAANLERGGAATGGRLVFHASDSAAWPRLTGRVTLWGAEQCVEQWLTARGLECRRLESDEPADPEGTQFISEVILVGKPDDADDVERWDLLQRRLMNGATVLFLSAQLFKDNPTRMARLPLHNTGHCKTVVDNLYHKECLAKRHPVFDGLQGPGIMDMDYYGPVIPHEVFLDMDTPDETICVGFNTGYIFIPRGYGSSLLIAHYRIGAGGFIVSTLYILENLDTHPAADRLLINLIRYAQQV